LSLSLGKINVASCVCMGGGGRRGDPTAVVAGDAG
jgi:hypothetical protein